MIIQDNNILFAIPDHSSTDPSQIDLSRVTLSINTNGPDGVPKNIRTGQVTADRVSAVPVHQVSLVINPGGLVESGLLEDGKTKLIIAFDTVEDLDKFKGKIQG